MGPQSAGKREHNLPHRHRHAELQCAKICDESGGRSQLPMSTFPGMTDRGQACWPSPPCCIHGTAPRLAKAGSGWQYGAPPPLAYQTAAALQLQPCIARAISAVRSCRRALTWPWAMGTKSTRPSGNHREISFWPFSTESELQGKQTLDKVNQSASLAALLAQ
jgi:hypothetical protein